MPSSRVPAPSGDEGDSPAPVTDRVTLIAFHADWFAPCRQMAPVVAEIARSLGDTADVRVVDVAADPAAARASHVAAIPTYVALGRDGAEVARLVGARPKAEVRDLVDRALAVSGPADGEVPA